MAFTMSDTQKPITSHEEEIDYSTTTETPTAPKSKSKPKRTPSSKKNKQESVTSSSEEIPTVSKSRSKSNRSPSSSNKKSASTRQRRPGRGKIKEADETTTAVPRAQEVREPVTKREPKKKAPAARQRATGSRKKPKAEPERQESHETSESAISLIGPGLDVPSVEGATDDAYTFIEAEPEVLPSEPDLDDTQPRIKTVTAPFVGPEPEVIELEPEVIEAEPEISPFEADLEDTLPRIKAVTTPLAEVEPALATDTSGANLTETPPELETVISTDPLVAVSTEAPAEPISSKQDILPEIIEAPLPPTPVLAAPERFERRRVTGKVLAGILLMVLIGSSLLLWRDISDTHLYLYALDPANGQTLAQQDLGGGYQGDTTITNPVWAESSLLFGVQLSRSSTTSKQQLVSLRGNDASWQLASQFSAPLTHATLSLAPNKRIIVVHADGLQVMTTGGQTLWQMQGDEPTMGTHPFQPAFDDSTLYTVKSAQTGTVAAYDLQSGVLRWTQKLDDTLKYAAPFLFYGNTLYIAADHTLYALNGTDGRQLWKVDRPTRTLLMLTERQPLLLSARSQGLAALSATTGAIAWSFSGQPPNTQLSTNETLLPAQFYQATVASTDHVIYATGIVWDAQQVQEQLWLFAVDATTGNLHWSERIGSYFTSADAGRIYSPLVDTTHGLVILQQAQDDGKRIIAAYSTAEGIQRWSVQLEGITAAAPNPLQVSTTALILLNTRSSSSTALHSLSFTRLLFISALGLSILGLLLLWMLSFRLWINRLRSTLKNLPRYLIYLLKLILRLWHFSRIVFSLVLLIILVGGGVLVYPQLARPQSYLNQVTISSGNIRWQHNTETPVQLAMTDTQGSIVITSAGKSLHRLTSLGSDGLSQWTSFSSEGSFSLPEASIQAGTVLVALSGRASPGYQFAPDDQAYAHPLDSLYTLYLLDRQTGQSIWQSTVVPPEEQQDTAVLGVDARFIYVASKATNPLPPGIGPVVQLIAVDKTSGNIAWRIFGPREPNTATTDFGSLFFKGRTIIWQVANTIYAFDTVLGQIQWRQYIAENLPGASLEEAQMAETAGMLLITRSDAYHALDPATGSERWVIANPGNGTGQPSGGVIAASNIFLIYGGRTLQAIDPTNQHLIWSQNQLEAVQSLKISEDGTMVYAIVANTLPGNSTTQALAALDLKTGAIRWTFQPFEQERFDYTQSDGFQYSNSMLYATVCLPGNQTTCDHEVLYALNATTGEQRWKFEANSIYNVRVSTDGDSVMFQTDGSTWGNLIERFRPSH